MTMLEELRLAEITGTSYTLTAVQCAALMVVFDELKKLRAESDFDSSTHAVLTAVLAVIAKV